MSCLRDHPRVCGEHLSSSSLSIARRGSSPRVRGTLWYFVTKSRASGIIPACAGNTWWDERHGVLIRDHPRVCGEHFQSSSSAVSSAGSSPRVRGTRSRRGSASSSKRIIPACAGNTECRWQRAARSWDHPRVCGEHFVTRNNLFWTSGSSPRVRGTQSFNSASVTLGGIIPACAGNTSSPR